jgi:type VI secretion system VasD/TssJ family lipoprotein
MKRSVEFVLVLLSMFAAFSCASKPAKIPSATSSPSATSGTSGTSATSGTSGTSAPSAPSATSAEWSYEKDAIRLHLKSDPQLNLYQGIAHTLLFCIYSLKDPNAFTQLAGEKDGIPKLLECGRFDPSVTQSKRLVIQPGTDVIESLDRPEGARYVGVAAGYYDLRKERTVRFFPIPLTQEKKGLPLISKSVVKPGVLDLHLTLGPEQLQETEKKVAEEGLPVTVIPAEWTFAKDAIRLHLNGDPQLNLYQGRAHTLLVCIYSLKDSKAFTQLADKKDGIPKLLECGRFHPSVTQAKRLVIQPGKDVVESLDRPEGARYVGVAAGYYDLRKERAVRFFPIPVTQEKRGNTLILKPGVFDQRLTLGPHQIQETGGK